MQAMYEVRSSKGTLFYRHADEVKVRGRAARLGAVYPSCRFLVVVVRQELREALDRVHAAVGADELRVALTHLAAVRLALTAEAEWR